MVLAVVVALITERIIEQRLGPWTGKLEGEGDEPPVDAAAESKGLRYALFAFLGFLALILALTLPPGAPLRDPDTGDIIGNTPFMDSLMFIITMMFLVAGIGYGCGRRHLQERQRRHRRRHQDLRRARPGSIFMLLMISQFIAYFNYSNMPAVLATMLAEVLERPGIGTLPLLIGLIIVVILLDIIMPGLIPKWAIFAPIFVPLFVSWASRPRPCWRPTGSAIRRSTSSPR